VVRARALEQREEIVVIDGARFVCGGAATIGSLPVALGWP
jgi:hypothetical protein